MRVVHPGSGFCFFTHPGSRIRIRNIEKNKRKKVGSVGTLLADFIFSRFEVCPRPLYNTYETHFKDRT